MENIRKFYLPIVHFVSLGLLVCVLQTNLYVRRTSGGVLSPYDSSYRVSYVYPGDILNEQSRSSMENRALIVYTLLAMYLGSGYLLFKQK